MDGPRSPVWRHSWRQRTACRVALLLALACALLLTTRKASAAPSDPPPCDPLAPSPSHCLVAEPYITERLSLRAAGDGLLFAMATAPGETQLRVLDAATLATLGVLPVRDEELLYQDGHLYTAPLSTTVAMPIVLGVRAANRPALLGSIALPLSGALDWAVAPHTLFALTHSQTGSGNELHVFSLQDASRPRHASVVAGLARTRIATYGSRLYAAGSTGLTILDATDPAALLTLAAAEWFADMPLVDVDMAAVGDFVYLMGRDLVGTPVCRIIDVRTPADPTPVGICPFLPGKTLVAGGFAYVNPNQSPAEYSDYAVYTITTPAAPTPVGTTAQRWRSAIALADAIVAQTVDGRLLRLHQGDDGSLTTLAQTWSQDELALDGAVRAVTGDMAIIDRGAMGDGGARVLALVDISVRSAPHPIGTLESMWIGAHNLVADGTRLYAMHRDRLTLFDLRDPAHTQQLGQFASPLQDTLEHLILDAPERAFMLSEHNTLLSVDLSTPLTPTLAAVVDLPGHTDVWAALQGTLYLFGNDTLLIVDVTQPGQPRLARSLPVPTPAAATAWGSTLYLVDNGVLQVLDLTEPLNPTPGMRIDPPAGMRYAAIGGAVAGRIALQTLRAVGGPAVSPYVSIFDVRVADAPRRAAIVAGDFADAIFDGARLILPGAEVVAIGPQSRDRIPLPAVLAEAIAIPLADPTHPTLALTYTIAADPPPVTETATVTATARCLLHESDPARPWLAPIGEATWAGPYMLRVVDCATGAPLAFDNAITVTVALPRSPDQGGDWAQATLAADLGDRWLPLPGAQCETGTLCARLDAPLMWGVRGPAPVPVLLPWIAR